MFVQSCAQSVYSNWYKEPVIHAIYLFDDDDDDDGGGGVGDDDEGGDHEEEKIGGRRGGEVEGKRRLKMERVELFSVIYNS